MKKVLILLLTGWLGFGPLQAKETETKNPGPRSVLTINRDWTFNYMPSGKEDAKVAASGFDDSKWSAIALPHTWQTYETTRDLHPFIMAASERMDPYWWNGWGYYRKRISVGRELAHKKLFLEFDGVQKYSKVYVNGHLVGDHKGGYTSFSFEITPYVKYGGENVISVAVSNRRDDKFGTIPPATAGNFNVYGGIYRDVRLVVTEGVYVPFQGSAEHEGGMFVTTPKVSSDEASVAIKTYVKNSTRRICQVEVKSTLLDPDGAVVAVVSARKKLAPDALESFDATVESVKQPRLWSPETPALYSVLSEVYADGVLTDRYGSPLGFRSFHWDYTDNTLVVNGKKIHIHGTNRHQEYPWLGDAIPKWITESDMMDIRYNLAHNFMRTGHYPNDPFVYDFNDRNGIITVEEVPNIKPIEFDDAVQEQNLREMIRRDRNHPSIFFWSMGNETKDAADSRWAVEEDTTRIIHERKTEGYGDYVTHTARNLDMENLLRVTIRGWYNKDVKNLEPVNKGKGDKSGQQAGTEEWQHKMARVDGGSIRGRIDQNIVAWLYEDHGADRIYKDSPLQNVNAKGWTDMYRVPKYMYYLWQANYLDRPMIFIHPHYWRTPYVGQKKQIQVDSNCDEVELFVNGRSQGKQYPTAENFHTVEFADVPVENGELKAVGTKDGERVEYVLTMAGEPYAIKLSVSHPEIEAGRAGLAIVTADIVDRAGIHVYGATQTLRWEVEGAATLVGPDVYESDIDKNSAIEGSGYIDAPVSNVIRSTAQPGRITVTVRADGLQSGSVTLCSVEPRACTVEGIVEPKLDDRGRGPVRRDLNYRETVEYVEEMKPILSPAQIEATTKQEYAKAMTQFVLERNPSMDKKSVEFHKLIRRLTTYIENVNGELTEDDYNFIARTYNDVRMLSGTIDSRNFHPGYAAELKEYYSTRMLVDGTMTDVKAEARKILGIDRDLDVVLYTPDVKVPNGLDYERTKYYYRTTMPTLDEVLFGLHPEWKTRSASEMAKIRKYLVSINPALKQEGDTWMLIPDRMIAIPKQL